MQEINFIFAVAVLIMSVVIHEVSHGYSASVMGDQTAKYAGRLSLNPFKHLDLMGSFIVPVMTFLIGGFVFGWAKPVPYNPHNLKNQKWGPAIVGLSGPLSNFLVAIVFGIIIRFGTDLTFLPASFFEIANLIVLINIVLGVFNLVPIPPLDGSKILFALLPYKWVYIEEFLEKYGFLILLFFILFLFDYILPIVYILFRIVTGIGI